MFKFTVKNEKCSESLAKMRAVKGERKQCNLLPNALLRNFSDRSQR